MLYKEERQVMRTKETEAGREGGRVAVRYQEMQQENPSVPRCPFSGRNQARPLLPTDHSRSAALNAFY